MNLSMTYSYTKLSNLTNGISVFIHFNAWGLSSVIRYFYIIHKDRIFAAFPSSRLQCCFAITLLLLFPPVLATPLALLVWKAGAACCL